MDLKLIRMKLLGEKFYYISVEQTSSPITPPDAYLFRVLPSNTANLQRIIDEMMKESASVPREVVELVLKKERMTMKRLLVSGWRINDELFDAMVQARGLTYNGEWDPQVNSLYVRSIRFMSISNRGRSCGRR